MNSENRRVLVNTAVGSVSRILGVGLAFFTTSILVNKLGEEAFGLYSIIAALPAYAGLLDFGIGAGLVKHLTEYSEAGDRRAVSQVMTLSLLFYLSLACVLTPVVYLLSPSIVRLLGVHESLHQAAESSILAMFLYFIGSGLVGVFAARIISMHRMDVTSAIALVGQISYAALVFTCIPLAPTILTAVRITIAQLAIIAVLTYCAVLRTDSNIYCNPLKIPRRLVGKLFAFGGWMQINSLTAVINLEADKPIIASFLGVAAVTPYQIGNRIASQNRIIPLQLLSALMPAATMVHVRKSADEAKAFYSNMSRYLMLLTLAITGYSTIAANVLVTTWIGKPYPKATMIVFALSLSFAINNLTGAGTTMVRAEGKPRYETYYAVLSMVLNIALTVALAPRYGLSGILGGTIIANVIGSLFFVILFHRRYHFSWFDTIGRWLWRLAIATLLSSALVYFMQSQEPKNLANSRVTGLAMLICNGAIYLLLLATSLTLLGFWTTNDLNAIRGFSKRLKTLETARTI